MRSLVQYICVKLRLQGLATGLLLKPAFGEERTAFMRIAPVM